jgi:hypothetical protein
MADRVVGDSDQAPNKRLRTYETYKSVIERHFNADPWPPAAAAGEVHGSQALLQ